MAKQYTELEYLARGQAGGKWGFQIPATALDATLATSSLLTVDMPAYMARAWTLNLQSFRFQNAAPAPNGLLTTNGQPPDNQTYNNLLKARLDFGVDSSLETVRFDYPSRGCSLQFHASTIRVYLEQPPAGFLPGTPIAPPLLGGFLTPHGRSAVAQDNIPCATFTTPQFSTVTGLPAFVWLPPRARGYRLIPNAATAAAATLAVVELDFAQATIAIDMVDPMSTGGVGDTLLMSRMAFVPLAFNAQGISVATGSVAPVFFQVQFLLDIG
jgi:hypothetical protein